MEALEQKLNYSFRNRALLQTALTHSSYANEHHCRSNERLEFVGDSVLGMVTAEHLYRAFPDMPEGKMTKLRAELVCEQSLGEVAQRLALGPSLRLGKGEELSGGRERLSILADCVEAVIAALYLDGGMAAARAFIDANVISKLNGESCLQIRDYKTELQELVQQQPGHTLVYELTGESGPDHMKRFEAAVAMDGRVLGSGEGRTKKEAEQMAAKAALEVM
ncbi:MAG: ribonuclease III [Ruminococcaceae bacterium]|nr:ribonuclease III [Oscillospiraceae bacterium]